MCKARVALRCPACKSKLDVTRPDSLHPLCSLEKPKNDEVEGDVIAQVYTCKNPGCNANITVYWHETRLF